jgi:hypothetical protein
MHELETIPAICERLLPPYDTWYRLLTSGELDAAIIHRVLTDDFVTLREIEHLLSPIPTKGNLILKTKNNCVLASDLSPEFADAILAALATGEVVLCPTFPLRVAPYKKTRKISVVFRPADVNPEHPIPSNQVFCQEAK